MSIGLMDADMATYTLVPFNLEIMKLSAYYKKRGEVVILSPQFTPDRHQKFYYRKDWNDGKFPINLTREPNVEYGGMAFSNKYVALPPEIEMSKPDTSIYSKMKSIILATSSTEKEKIFRNMMEAEHCRISLDGKTIWPQYEKQFHDLSSTKNLMIHDYNLGEIEGSFDLVKDILNHARTDGWATRVGMKFPVVVSSGKDLLNWTSLRPNSTFYSLQYNGVIDMDSFIEFVGRNKEKSIYKQLDYNITATSSGENDFLKNKIREIFKQVIISRSYKVFFTLKYEDDFFFDKRWEKVIDLFNFYHNSYSNMSTSAYLKKIGDDTLYDFANNTYNHPPTYYTGKVFTRNEIKEIFRFVEQANPDLFHDFYECSYNSLGGLVC